MGVQGGYLCACACWARGCECSARVCEVHVSVCVRWVIARYVCTHRTHVGMGIACVWYMMCTGAHPRAVHCALGMCVKCVHVHLRACVVWVCPLCLCVSVPVWCVCEHLHVS